MTTMEVMLSDVLATKYNITEPLAAAGNFVPVRGVPNRLGLTAIGITAATLFVARICLSGVDIDYDVTSITPLSLITVGVESYQEKKIFVKSQFKSQKVYQLCSGEESEEVWKGFVATIERLNTRGQGDGWMTPYLEPVPSEANHKSSSLRQLSLHSDTFPYRNDVSDVLNRSAILSRCVCPSKGYMSHPKMYPMRSATYGLHDLNTNFNSVEWLSVKFDAFVNDAQNLNTNQSNNCQHVSTGGSDVGVTVHDTAAVKEK